MMTILATLIPVAARGQDAAPRRWEVPQEPDRYNGYAAGTVIDQGGYPATGVFGWDLPGNPYSETLSVRRRIHASNTTHAAPVAVAGYAMTESNVNGAVGVFGMGSTAVNAPGVFGGNFLATNCGADDVFGQHGGFDTMTYGIEVDVNVHPRTDGTQTLGAAYGVHISGGSTLRPASGSSALHIDPMDGYTRMLPWTNGILTEDGAAQIGIRLGALANTGQTDQGSGRVSTPHPAGVASQSIAFRAIDVQGAVHEASVQADPGGSLRLLPGQHSAFVVADGLFKATAGLEVVGGILVTGTGTPRAVGGTIAEGSNDTRGRLIIAPESRSCTVTFATPLASPPFVTVTSHDSSHAASLSGEPTQAGFVIDLAQRPSQPVAVTYFVIR